MFRRKNDNSGSVTFNETRVNDDFFLKRSVALSSDKKGFFCPFALDTTKDFSIYFTINIDSNSLTGANALFYWSNDAGTALGNDAGFFQNGTNINLSNNGNLYSLATLEVDHTTQIFINYDFTNNKIFVYKDASLVNEVQLLSPLTFSKQYGFYTFFIPDAANAVSDCYLKDLAFFDRRLLQKEMQTFYTFEFLPQSTHENCHPHLVLNQIPSTDTKNISYGKNTSAGGWDSGVIFFDELIGDGYVEFDALNTTSFFMVGLTDSATNPTPSWNFPFVSYGIYADTTGNYQRTISGSLSPLGVARTKKDTLRVQRDGLDYTFYINGVLVSTFTDAGPVQTLRPCISVLSANTFNVNNIIINGVKVFQIKDSSNLPTLKILDVSSNYDYAKLTPVIPKHGTLLGWDNDELGLNIGTSTFTAYADFYTKIAGANFSGGGDSVIYKGKELRKYGLKFNGIDQYLSVPFTLAKDKGYTIEIAFTMPTNVAFASTQPILSKRDGATNYIEVLGDSTKKTLSLKYIDTGVEVGAGNVNTAQDISKMQYSVMRVSPVQNVYLKESIATYEKVYANNQIQCVQWNSVTGQTEGINPFDEITVGFDDITGNLNIGYDGTNYFGGTLFAVRIWEGLLDVGENQINRNNGLLRNANDVTYSSKSNLKIDIDFNNPFDSGGLKLNDTSPNAAVLDAFGWANLAAIEAAREEILSKF